MATLDTIDQILKETKEAGTVPHLSSISTYCSSTDSKIYGTNILEVFNLFAKYGFTPEKMTIVQPNGAIFRHGPLMYGDNNGYRRIKLKPNTVNFEFMKKYIKITEQFENGFHEEFVDMWIENNPDDFHEMIAVLYNSKHKLNPTFIYQMAMDYKKKIFDYNFRYDFWQKSSLNFYGAGRLYDFYEKYPFNIYDLCEGQMNLLREGATKMRPMLERITPKPNK